MLCEYLTPQYGSPALAPQAGSLDAMAAVALAALYLEGAPRGLAVPKSRWPAVLARLRAECPLLGGAARVLRRGGFVEESLALEEPRLLDWAERRVRGGVALTAASLGYPEVWARKLGGAAPAALWIRGSMPSPPYLGIVGSRYVSAPVRSFAFDCGAEAGRLGLAVVSGGACGCDRAAARGAASEHPDLVVEILPCGLNRRRERFPGCAISPFAPDAEFSAASAMVRNSLIYAMGEAALLVQARFGEGGTWNGALSAHRRRLCPLIVREGGGRASRALVALGAVSLASPGDLGSAFAAALGTGPQLGLNFSS